MGVLMTKLLSETGKFIEIGSGKTLGAMRYYSHILMQRDDETIIRLEHVATDDFIEPSIRIGGKGTIVFLNRTAHFAQSQMNVPVRNGIVGFADETGYLPPKESPKNYLPHFFLTIAAGALIMFMMTRDSSHPFLTGFVSLSFLVMFGSIGGIHLRGMKKADALRADVITFFERAGLKPQASIVYR